MVDSYDPGKCSWPRIGLQVSNSGDPAALDDIMGLRAKGLRSVAILPLGYRADEGDWLVNLKKVRRPREQFVTNV